MATKRERWSSNLGSNDSNKIKRRKTTNDSSKLIFTAFSPGSQLDRLPDNVTLLIMYYLDVVSLIYLAMSCKRFYHLSRENELWIHVDMTTLPFMDIRKMKKFIQQKLSPDLHSVIIKSDYPHHGKSKSPKVDGSTLDTLLDKCPKIKNIELQNCDLTNFLRNCKLTQYSSLQSVSIIRCNTPLHWLKGVKWPLLKKLSLAESVMTTPFELRAILESEDWQKSLECLDITGCYRCIEFIDTEKPLLRLKKLYLSSTGITDSSLELIAKLPSLEELYLKNLTLTEKGLCKIPVLFPNLKVIDISCVRAVNKLILEEINKYMPFTTIIFLK